MKEYTVTCTETCAECEGHGIVSGALWADFWKVFSAAEAADKNVDFGKFLENYENNVLCGGPGCLGPEEHECIECDGRGKITRSVPLADALYDLLNRLVTESVKDVPA